MSVKVFAGDDGVPSRPKRKKFLKRRMQSMHREIRENRFRDWVKDYLDLELCIKRY
jgi:hypothetical protein